MKFALETLRSVVHGDTDRRVRALLVYGIWFAVGAFLASSVQQFVPIDGEHAPIVGGVALSAVAVFFKLS